jgi:hypothetical protein
MAYIQRLLKRGGAGPWEQKIHFFANSLLTDGIKCGKITRLEN